MFPKLYLSKVIFSNVGFVRVPPNLLKNNATFRDIFRVPTRCHLRNNQSLIVKNYEAKQRES